MLHMLNIMTLDETGDILIAEYMTDTGARFPLTETQCSQALDLFLAIERTNAGAHEDE